MNKKSSKPVKKPMARRTKFTIFAMINIIWYTIVVLIAAFTDHEVQSDLTVAWFAAWTVELALLFGIKINSKDDNSSDDDNLDTDNTDSSANDNEEDINENDISEVDNSSLIVQDESNMEDYEDIN